MHINDSTDVMLAGKLSVNACVNVSEHAPYKKEMFPNTWWIWREQSAESGEKTQLTASAYLTAKDFVVCLNETFKISLIILWNVSHLSCQRLTGLLTASRGEWSFIFLLLLNWMIDEQTKADSCCKDIKNQRRCRRCFYSSLPNSA